MTIQRRRQGIPAKIWKIASQQDNRGNVHKVLSEDPPHEVKVWVFPQRSARAEVPGQQHINVIRIGVRADITDVELWSRVEIFGRLWDVVAPPAYHHGTRATRHFSIDLRERP